MDEIRITIPAERSFGAVAGLVLGGLAARHEITLDVLDDLQLALDGLIAREEDDAEVTIALRVSPDAVEASVGPFGAETVAELEHEAGVGLGLRRLLDTLVDAVSVEERDGESWIELRKSYELAART
jgi:hypothetical protein